MKVSDAVFHYLVARGIEKCFSVTGGAAAHLFDSLSRSSIETIHMHHEQSCAMAADGYARIAKKPALVLVTNGPGVSNTITGVLGAFQDSIPMIILSGQVPTYQMIENGGGAERQFGVQEVETGRLVSSIVKYYFSIHHEDELEEALNLAWEMATSGRPGPVWIEIPLDIQVREIEPITLAESFTLDFQPRYQECVVAINQAKKPILVVGGGVHTSNSEMQVIQFAKSLGIPVVSTWGANDLYSGKQTLYLGNFGILGNRIPNIAVQESDLLLILGSRMTIPNTGYNTASFSPDSFRIMVNIDSNEMKKASLRVDLDIQCDLKLWLQAFPFEEIKPNEAFGTWGSKLSALSEEFGLQREKLVHEPGRVDSYQVVECLSQFIESDATLVTDMGTSFTCTMQAFRNLHNTRLFTSSGTSSMGFGLPGAIGAYFAAPERPIYLVAGDGGFQMNIQELQTVKYHNIPIRMIILNSRGYLAISIMQQNLFEGNFVGSNRESGIDSPNFRKIGVAYGLKSKSIKSKGKLVKKLKSIRGKNLGYLLEIELPSKQLMRPRSQSLKNADGVIHSQGIHVMWPYLTQQEINKVATMLK
jgi:acetolactate synthase I/II/III large subunit